MLRKINIVEALGWCNAAQVGPNLPSRPPTVTRGMTDFVRLTHGAWPLPTAAYLPGLLLLSQSQ